MFVVFKSLCKFFDETMEMFLFLATIEHAKSMYMSNDNCMHDTCTDMRKERRHSHARAF